MAEDNNVAIRVENLSKSFKLPHEVNNSLKGVVVNFWRLNRSYEKQKVLKNISFTVEKGDFYGIVGRNGSGKSTLLKLLAGIYTPDSGSITVNGLLTPFIELGVGFNHELTGRENIFLNGALLGFNRKEMSKMYESIVEFAELEKFMDQKLKNYSSGMQVRLAFSIAIRAKGDILLLDEVLAVGDASFQQKCYDYFEELKKEKRTVVFISHDMSAVRRFCTKAMYLKNGRIVKVGLPVEVADEYMINNIENTAQKTKKEQVAEESSARKVSVRVLSQTEEKVQLEFAYEASAKDDTYIGISIQRDGVSVAEITTNPDKPLKGSGSVGYTVDTTLFNTGVYQVGAGLFRCSNREILAATKTKAAFIIKGEDITRGSAVRLADNWQYK